MFENLKKRRLRNARIAELDAYEAELSGAKTEHEKYEADQIAHAVCQREENELTFLRQEDIIQQLKNALFEVSDGYWINSQWGLKKVLTKKGEAWARAELWKHKKDNIEFFSKLIIPIVALLISIAALVKKSH